MCGIIGFNWNDKKLLKNGLRSINHRGPDATGVFIDNKISLGHKRLSIIDLSSKGNQPMSNEKGDIWITFNGEIYNFKELKKSLKQKHDFKSDTDTEVLVHLYEEEGINLLEKLIGMFAFCIYDARKKMLFLARDRVGIKPFYYYNKEKKFIFSSEIKGILQDPEIKREVNKEAIPYFLSFRANTLEESMFKGIKKLMPGHFAVYNLNTNEMQIKQYWKINPVQGNYPESYYSEKLFKLLEDSVKLRLISDVPYGAYLSGGIDSGAIVSLMSKFSSQPVKTFSVGFEEEEDTELNEARFLAQKINTEHHELLINHKSIKFLPQIVNHLDEPMSDPTSIPIFLLSRYAKKYCSVILTGEGSDELFAGYPQYKFMKLHHKFIRHMPKIFRNQIPKIIKTIPSDILNRGFRFASSLGEKGIERFSNFINTDDFSKQYLNQVSIFNEEESSEFLNSKQSLYKDSSKYFKNTSYQNIVNNCLLFDFNGNMVEDLLMKLDKNTMAFSIEGRVPFLDHRIVELAFSMPQDIKLRGFSNDKFILRKSVRGIVPEQTNRRKKRHFFVPIDSWLSHELSSLTKELLSEKFINKQNIFNYNYIEKINRRFENSRLFYARQLWSILTFQIWYKQHIENEKVKI